MVESNLNKSNDIRQRAYDFSLMVINFTKDFPYKGNYLIFANQLVRSATSIGANLVEAKSSSSRKDFARYHEIALRNSNETKYWLSLLKDAKLVDDGKTLPIIGENEEISRMICASLKTIRKAHKV